MLLLVVLLASAAMVSASRSALHGAKIVNSPLFPTEKQIPMWLPSSAISLASLSPSCEPYLLAPSAMDLALGTEDHIVALS